MRKLETRIVWNASSNISFRGETDWIPSDAPDVDTAKREEEEYGLEAALEGSGFEWYVEVREAS